MGNYSLDCSPGYLFYEALSQWVPPAKLNPLSMNPLRDLVARLVDLVKELRSIHLLHQLIDAEGLELEHLSASSKMNAGWPVLTELQAQGYRWAGDWLDNP